MKFSRNVRKRGAALVVALIVLFVILFIAGGAILFTSANRTAAASKMSNDELQSCADTAKRYLLARLASYGKRPLSAKNLVLAGVNVSSSSVGSNEGILKDAPLRACTGAYGGNCDAGVSTDVVLPAKEMSGADQAVRDIANQAGVSTVTGSYHRLQVLCESPGHNRQAMTEFVFKLAL